MTEVERAVVTELTRLAEEMDRRKGPYKVTADDVRERVKQIKTEGLRR
jgi:hypothetical protein